MKNKEKNLEDCEDPRFLGKIKILKANKCDEKGVYLLKVKFEKEEDD